MNLSPGRFAALFARDTAMSLRIYLRWRRVLTAARLIREGKSITVAAIAAGFADSAHLTRTYRATFGTAPSSQQGIRVVQPTSARHRESTLA